MKQDIEISIPTKDQKNKQKKAALVALGGFLPTNPLVQRQNTGPLMINQITKKTKPGAKPGNQNAAKADTDKAASFIHARCTPADKAGWVHAAQRDGLKLTEWIVKILNTAAKP